jgi:hypothetical protein
VDSSRFSSGPPSSQKGNRRKQLKKLVAIPDKEREKEKEREKQQLLEEQKQRIQELQQQQQREKEAAEKVSSSHNASSWNLMNTSTDSLVTMEGIDGDNTMNTFMSATSANTQQQPIQGQPSQSQSPIQSQSPSQSLLSIQQEGPTPLDVTTNTQQLSSNSRDEWRKWIDEKQHMIRAHNKEKTDMLLELKRLRKLLHIQSRDGVISDNQNMFHANMQLEQHTIDSNIRIDTLTVSFCACFSVRFVLLTDLL